MKTRLIQFIARGLMVLMGAAALRLGADASELSGAVETIAAGLAAVLLFFGDILLHRLQSKSTIAASILKLLEGDAPALPANLSDEELATVRKFAESLKASRG